MEAVAAPLCLVSSDAYLLFANSAAKLCLEQSRWLHTRMGRINAPGHHRSAPPFELALERLKRGDGSTVLLTNSHSGCQAVVTVAPISQSTGTTTALERLGLIWLTTSEPDATPVGRLAHVFGLTCAEQRLLSELAAGTELREAAARLAISIHTARNQLKSVLRKTGRHSQAQLLTLVTRMASLRLSDQD